MVSRYVGLSVALCLVFVAWPRPNRAAELPPGEPSAGSAAGSIRDGRTSQAARLSLREGWRRGFAEADTTGYVFPEDEPERTTAQLVKDIVLWTAVAGFVAFFIIKVFLEGDEPEPPDENPGKPPPIFSTTPATAPRPAS
jgi:hypothetical protein